MEQRASQKVRSERRGKEREGWSLEYRKDEIYVVDWKICGCDVNRYPVKVYYITFSESGVDIEVATVWEASYTFSERQPGSWRKILRATFPEILPASISTRYFSKGIEYRYGYHLKYNIVARNTWNCLHDKLSSYNRSRWNYSSSSRSFGAESVEHQRNYPGARVGSHRIVIWLMMKVYKRYWS